MRWPPVSSSENILRKTDITDLRNQVGNAVDKIKFLSSETAIKYMEADIVKLEGEITELMAEKQKTAPQEAVDMDKLSAYVRYYLEHLDELLLHHCNPVLQARYFGVIFNVAPTYNDIVSGTPDVTKITGVNEIFLANNPVKGLMAGHKERLPNLGRSLIC